VRDHLHQRHAALVEHRVVKPLRRLGQPGASHGDTVAHQPRQLAGVHVHREQRGVGEVGALQRVDHRL